MNCREALVAREILTQWSEEKLPLRGALRIAHMQEDLTKIAQVVEKKRMELVNELAERDENGELRTEEGRFVFSDENELEFARRYAEMMAEPVDFGLKLEEAHLGTQERSVEQIMPLVALGLLEMPK